MILENKAYFTYSDILFSYCKQMSFKRSEWIFKIKSTYSLIQKF